MRVESIPLIYYQLTVSQTSHHGHDTHAMPPQKLCDLYKKYQKMKDEAVDDDLDIVDFRRGLTTTQKEKLVPIASVPNETISEARKVFKQQAGPRLGSIADSEETPACTVYEHKDFDGLRLYPNLLPPECQFLMLSALLHRDLSNPLHKTNLHPDYDLPYPTPLRDSSHPASFFTLPQSSKNHTFKPLNPHSNHKPLHTIQALQKRLRWLTLGSQYDWTTRSYPSTSPTPFPPDIASLVTTLFSNAFKPESGVVLLYSSKDYMPVHRDVSEECARGLASFTLGCDGLFIVARDKEGADETDDERDQEMVVLRVRSGDVVQMGGKTRFAWHAMPKILDGTGPKELESWPVGEGTPREYEKWKGFMKGKRLNISCRQVWGE